MNILQHIAVFFGRCPICWGTGNHTLGLHHCSEKDRIAYFRSTVAVCHAHVLADPKCTVCDGGGMVNEQGRAWNSLGSFYACPCVIRRAEDLEPPCRDDDHPCGGIWLLVCNECWTKMDEKAKFYWVLRCSEHYRWPPGYVSDVEFLRAIRAEGNFVLENGATRLRRGKPRTVKEREAEGL